jgi:cystathionine gamma-synthase
MTFSVDPATAAVRASLETDTQHGAVVPPLHLSSNYTFKGFGEKREYDYTRSGNPTRDALADALCELEGGAGATVTSSGMAALNLVLRLTTAMVARTACLKVSRTRDTSKCLSSTRLMSRQFWLPARESRA